MNTAYSVEYQFDELPIFGHGMMAYGVAELADDGCGEFCVASICLDDGTVFTRHGTGGLGSNFTRELFDRMAQYIENSDHAQEFFKDKMDEASVEPDGDYQYQAWKDRQMDDQWQEAAE